MKIIKDEGLLANDSVNVVLTSGTMITNPYAEDRFENLRIFNIRFKSEKQFARSFFGVNYRVI